MDLGEQIMLVQTPKRMNLGEQITDDKPESEQMEELPLRAPPTRHLPLTQLLPPICNIALSAFYFGYMLLYLNIIDFATAIEIFNIDLDPDLAMGIVTFCLPVGGLFGALSSSYFLKHFSRKQSILLINYVAFALGILLYFANFKLYMLIRFAQGMCSGIYSTIVPLIIKEMAPAQLSGFFGVFQQIFITLGLFICSIFAFILGLASGDQTGASTWKWIFGLPLVTLTLQTVLLHTIYNFQTPRYQLSKNKEENAKQILTHFYYQEYIDEIVIEIKSQLQQASQGSSQQSQQPFLPKLISIHLSLMQQFVGISAVLTYGREMAQGNLSSVKALLPTLLNLEQVIFSGLSSLLLSRYGRKTILHFGTIGAATANIIIASGFWLDSSHPELALALVMIGLIYYMASFNLTLGPVVWLYIPQIVDSSFLPYSTMVNWGSSAFCILVFPILKAHLPGRNPAPMFLFFAIWSILSFGVNKRFVVQTWGKTTRQVKEAFRGLSGK